MPTQQNNPVIAVRQLCKTFKVPEREPGITAAIRSLFRPKMREVCAVSDLSFTINPGEMVGFIGPNGAGKTTTLKMLSGLLHPSSGTVSVLGYNPALRDNRYLTQMTLVMGQRNQLIMDIPVADSFEMNRAIYKIPDDRFKKVCGLFEELLDLKPLLKKPARTLSLGERMKCEIAASLLHEPKMLFLDEPTIGLDVTMQRRIREFIGAYNQLHQASVMLTSHYMADVEILCKRVIVIHRGQLLFDGALSELMNRFSLEKTINIQLRGETTPDLSPYGTVTHSSLGTVRLRVKRADTAITVSRLLNDLDVHDLTVEDPPVEEVVDQLFCRGSAC